MFHSDHHRPEGPAPRSADRPVAVGFLSGDDEFWLLLAGSGAGGGRRPPVELPGPRPAMRMCRAVHGDGRITLAPVDSEREALLSEILES